MSKPKSNASKQGINHHLAAGSPLENYSETTTFISIYIGFSHESNRYKKAA
ncbi:hypothetical protein GMES_1949 [Paraglaciecola mesophila KMM 241]|uniref:Uncharacterized protein n=1 Tax=Paraglaciecola mesophila KMM 241 TaxID=1128912 RepID=K6ZLK4_9ALTE|nr:hypothetical protein GMES_1949 [Paraglaciecola mesophila KMM 241]